MAQEYPMSRMKYKFGRHLVVLLLLLLMLLLLMMLMSMLVSESKMN